MAFFQIHFFSDALGLGTSMNVMLPQRAYRQIGAEVQVRESCPTLYLLHGLSDDETIWCRRTSIERYAEAYGLAVVMPAGGRSWYTDGIFGNYFTFISEELPRICRNFFPQMSTEREKTFVAGLSMGGYGAFKCALRAPQTFGAAGSLSGAMDIYHPDLGPEHKILFEEGRLCEQDDLFLLSEKLLASDAPKPRLFQWCGTEDFLYQDNLRFRDRMIALEYPDYHFEQSEGDHNWYWWDMKIQAFLKWAF